MKLIRRAAIAAILATALAPLAAVAETTTIRLGLITPPPHIWTKAADAFGADLATATDGRLTVQVFPSAQLGNEAQMIQQLQTGALDMAFVTGAELSNRVPDFGAFYAPFLADDIAHAGRIIRDPGVKPLLDQLPQALGVVGLGMGQAGLRQIVSRPGITGASGLKGLKIRITPFEPLRDFYTGLGAAPTPMPLPSVYDALANGQVDAIDMDAELIWAMKFYEKAPNVLATNQMMFPVVGIMSGKVWAGLSDDDKVAIGDLVHQHLDATIDAYVERDPEWLAEVKAAEGVTFVEGAADSFAEANAKWDAIWSERAPFLATMRQIAEQTR